MKEAIEYIKEQSNLARIFKHIKGNDCAMLTAWRKSYTKSENGSRNGQLKAILLGLGYSAIKVNGIYIEGYGSNHPQNVKEDSFFVVNIKNDNKFFSNIEKLGEHYEQDSILCKPKDSIVAYLLGTNNDSSSFPAYKQKYYLGIFKGGIKSEFMSTIRNRPFVFTESKNYNNTTRYVQTNEARKFLKSI